MSPTEHKRKHREPDGDHSGAANRLLRGLTPAEYSKFAVDCETVSLAFKETLYEQGKRVNRVYFPTSGVVSIITVLDDDSEPVETGTIGREGFVGLPVFLEALHAPARALCQVPGSALCMPVDRFAAGVKQVDALRVQLLRYTNVFMTMIAQTAACNRAHDTKARMARWLLMTHDRVDGVEFPLTQEFLGQMLGVRRPAVSLAGVALQRDGVIKYRRGKITVVDRGGLERAACLCYKRIRREFIQHFGDIEAY